MSNYVQNYALVEIINSLFSFILRTFVRLFSLKRLRTKKSSHLLLYTFQLISVHIIHIGTLKHIITISTYNTHIGTLKYIILLLAEH